MKFNRLIAVVLAIILCASPAFAEKSYTFARSYTIENKTASNLVTYIPTSADTVGYMGDYIFPSQTKILGYEVKTEGVVTNGAGAWATLYDAASAAYIIRGEAFGEVECSAGSYSYMPFPDGKEVYNGVTVIQSAHSIVTIHYSR